MEYYFDDSEESDDEICFDEGLFKQFSKLVHCNRATNEKCELRSKVDYRKTVDADNAGSNFDKPIADIFNSTPNKKIKNIDTNCNTPLMESNSKISEIQTLLSPTSLNTTPDFDESFTITEEQVEKCDLSGNSESSNELNDTLELIEHIFNNKHNDQDIEHIPDKELNLPLSIEPFSGPDLHPIPIQNIKKCDPTFEATSLGCQIVHTDNSVLLVDKQGIKICNSQGNAGSIEIDDGLESVEHILTKNGTCISVYTYSLFNLNMKNCDSNFATNLLSDKPRASKYKTLMSLSIKKPSPITLMKTEAKRNTYHYTSSSLAAYVKNVTQEASLEEVCSKKPLLNTLSISELHRDCCTLKHNSI